MPEAIVPNYSTESSACFDLHACIPTGTVVSAKVKNNCGFTDVPYERDDKITSHGTGTISIYPGSRVLVPTGLKFHIPELHSLRLHPRSGLAFKNGLMLANCEGVIDEDYVEEVYVALYNASNDVFILKHGDRIAQAELVCDTRIKISESLDAPKRKTTRSGGFGSTGV